MLLQPNRTKFKKLKKKYLTNFLETRSFKLHQGKIGLKAMSSLRITARQIEAVRQCVTRGLGRQGKVWVNIFPHIPVTSKPTENRMGKGKGAISYWCAPVKIGAILFEITGVSLITAKVALQKGANKLPIRTKIVFK
jgi:large subunit ribosomal protein L16